MATLAFCTAYGAHRNAWRFRYRRWVEAMLCSGLQFDMLLLVDDGSPMLPGWPDADVLTSLVTKPEHRISVYHFHHRLGRQARTVYPGWYRSFCLAARYAMLHGFDRVIHVESDAFLISAKAITWLNNVSDGWETPWCPRIQGPESAIQVMAGSGFRSFVDHSYLPYSKFVGIDAEQWLPFTQINRDLTGDRHGPVRRDIPCDADWTAQALGSTNRGYFWWLPDKACADLLVQPKANDRAS